MNCCKFDNSSNIMLPTVQPIFPMIPQLFGISEQLVGLCYAFLTNSDLIAIAPNPSMWQSNI